MKHYFSTSRVLVHAKTITATISIDLPLRMYQAYQAYTGPSFRTSSYTLKEDVAVLA